MSSYTRTSNDRIGFITDLGAVVSGVEDTFVIEKVQDQGVGLVVRPSRDGFYSDWSVYPSAWSDMKFRAVKDASPYTLNYVYINSAVGDAITFGLPTPILSVGCPSRITGICVEWHVKGDSGSCVLPLFRLFDEDYRDTDPIYPPEDWVRIQRFYPINFWTGRPWTSNIISFLEVGLYNNDTKAVQLAKLQVNVTTEALPSKSVYLGGEGFYQDFDFYPTTGTSIDTLNKDDGGRSYIYTDVSGDKISLRPEETSIPSNFLVDQVDLEIRVKGEGKIVPLVRENQIDSFGVSGDWEITPSEDQWQTHRVPFPSPPSFQGGRWELDDILSTEWGVKSTEDKDVKVGSLKLDILASLHPEFTDRILPTGTGTWSEWEIGEPNTGELPYQDVNSYLPNDLSYLVGNSEYPNRRCVISTFPLSVLTSQNWYGIKWTARVKKSLTSTVPALVAPAFTKIENTFIDKPFVINNTSDFVEISKTFWLNPFTGLPWDVDGFNHFQVGIACLEGVAYCSHLFVDAGISPPREAPIESAKCEFTSTAAAILAAASTQSISWVVDTFEVGRGGYDIDNPQVILPVESADDDLADLVYTGKVEKSHFVDTTAYYWVVIPPDVLSEPIGEIALKAQVLGWVSPSGSPPEIDVGDYFTMAVAHFPAGFHTSRSIRVLRLELEYGA